MPLQRPVILDAANIAYCHGDDKSYETKGILLATEYFLKQGHKPYIVVHHSRTVEEKLKEHADMSPKSKQLMLRLSKKSSDNILMKNGLIVPARKNANLDDDEFILSLADQHGGFVISRDNFQKQGNDYPHWLPLIKSRVMDFTFCGDVFHQRILQKNCLKCYDDDQEYERIARDQLTDDEISRATSFIKSLIDSNGEQISIEKKQYKQLDKKITAEIQQAVPEEPKSVHEIATLTEKIKTFSKQTQTISGKCAGKDSFTQTEEKHDLNRRKGTITFALSHFKAFTLEGIGAEINSPIEHYRGIPWCISIMINPPSRSPHKQIGVYLAYESQNLSSSWTRCEVKHTKRIVSQTDDVADHVKNKDDIYIFTRKCRAWGDLNFMGLEVVLNPQMGYIKDGTVIFEIDIEVEPPQ